MGERGWGFQTLIVLLGRGGESRKKKVSLRLLGMILSNEEDSRSDS